MNMDVLSKLTIAIIVVVLVAIFGRKSDPERARREALRALAKRLHLQFSPKNDFKLAERYSFLSWLWRGEVRYAYNALHGNYQGWPVVVFDYHFSTPSGGRGSGYDYYWSAFIVEMKTDFPDLIISRETIASRVAEALGQPDIAFESSHFSRAFRVRSADKRFAYDVCHPRMMEYLLANQDLTVEISSTALAVLFEDWLHPEKVESDLSRLIEIRRLLPDYLFTKD